MGLYPVVPEYRVAWTYGKLPNDYRTWTLRLVEGAIFSDGTPLNAETAIEFWRWVQSLEGLAALFPETGKTEKIEAIDEWTLQYTTSVPISNSPDYDFQWIGFGDPKFWTQFDESTVWTAEPYPPNGTGPYTLTEHELGSHLILDAKPEYHGSKPPIDRIVYQIYSNVDALVSAFVADEIDMTGVNMPPETHGALASVPDAVVEEKPPGDVHRLYFNMYPGGAKHPAIGDPAVREAIDYAIDKQRIVDIALLGHGILCPTSWSCGPNYEGEINPDLRVYPYDPDYANQVLDAAGYSGSDGDGVRETADGKPLESRLYYQAEVPQQTTIADLLAPWLEEIGIRVTTEAQETSMWLQSVTGDRDYDMALYSIASDVDPAGMDFVPSC